MALTPYSPFFLSGLIASHPDTSYLDFAESQSSIRSYPSLKRKPSSLRSEIQPPRLRHRSSDLSLREFPVQKPEPSSPLPPQPLATSTNRPILLRKPSNISTVPSSYKRRKRTDALAALEGRRPLPSDSHKDFMNFSDDDEDDESELDPDVEAAVFYGKQVSIMTEARTMSTGLSSFSFGFPEPPALAAQLTSTLDLTEDQVLPPPSPMGQLASKPLLPPPVPTLAMPSPPRAKKSTKPNKAHVSFLPFSPVSSSSSYSGPNLPMDHPTPISSVPQSVPDVPASVDDHRWKAIVIESPFLPPFTFEDIDIDFSLPRPAPSPHAYSPPIRPARRSEDDLPVQSELALKQFEAAARAALASPNKSPSRLTRSGSRTRTISSPSRSSSRRTKKAGRQAFNAMSSFIEFDLRSSISSKPSRQSLLTSYWKDNASTSATFSS
ncbi:hypothetical protein DL96DRAFT_1583386 [Flagelloscypha sp. PMI_526]|nr:hypothetical protein DL96DRAFT_1583386 [Flagelloscypha sp. PMI_526]